MIDETHKTLLDLYKQMFRIRRVEETISEKYSEPHKTGFPRFPSAVGTQIALPSAGSNAANNRSICFEDTLGISPWHTTMPSTLSAKERTPILRLVLRPSPYLGL